MALEDNPTNESARTRPNRTRSNYTLSVIIACLLSLVVWEVFLRDVFFGRIRYSFDEPYAFGDEETLFRSLDIDRNGLLSTHEWMPYFLQCSAGHRDERSVNLSQKEQNNSLPLNHEINVEEIITIRSFFEPVRLETLKKDLSSFSVSQPGVLGGLISWNRPRREWQNFAAGQFSVFLPPEGKGTMPGDTWWLVSPMHGSSGQLSSNRHYPPTAIAKHLKFLSQIFGMLHPRPFLVTRFLPQGTLAVLRGTTKSHILDIVFRAHIEFQLNEPPDYPFWLTPSQLRGRIVIDQKTTTVHYISIELPTDRQLNVDMEWLNGPDEFENMEVDIAFVPRMALKSTGPSVKVNLSEISDVWDSAISGPEDYEKHIESLEWDGEVSMEEAVQILKSQMYTFTQVRYYNLTDAFSVARNEKKSVHAILLWGSLDDQSC